MINPAGEIITRYEKMFPFYPYEAGITPGSAFCVFDVEDVGRFGVSNCYDIWFPETSRTLAAMGAEVILHPVMTTYIDRDIDLDQVRRQRRRGIRTLGQPLKSWRDNQVEFDIYRKDYDHSYLESLGALSKPHRNCPE